MSDQSEGRDYVDDMVAVSTTSHECPRSISDVVDDVTQFWQITDSFRTATTLTLNAGKSNLFGTTSELRRALALTGGPKVKDDFLDLGVV